MTTPSQKVTSKEKQIWTVHYGNYFPREVESCWNTKEEAEKRVEELEEENPADSMWRVERIK